MEKLSKLSLWTVLAFVVTSLMFTQVTFATTLDEKQSNPHKPYLIGKGNQVFGKGSNGNSETPGEWYVGDTPENVRPNSPVLLFVHGLNSKAQVWWEGNDMYDTAFHAGFETAFVQLHDAGGASADMWNNGMLLAEKIAEISDHFNGKRITIVAHSKGGVDTQTALSHYGAWQYVDNVITLGSPHHGSQLADLAYSAWAGWLADLIGMKGEGTESMQMGYMENFRSQMDVHPLAYANNYYTLGGTSWGPVFSANWFGGMYLSSYGQNDGVVTAASSRLPFGFEIAVGSWDHSEIRTGTTFHVFQSHLSSNPLQKDLALNFTRSVRDQPDGNKLVRGGELSADTIEKVMIPIESGNEKVTISLLTADELTHVQLFDPTGKVVSKKINQSINDDGIFSGSIHYNLTIPNPIAGEWVLELQTKTNNAYVITTHYHSPHQLNVYKDIVKDEVTYHILSDNRQLAKKNMKATYRITSTNTDEQPQTFTVTGDQNLTQKLKLSKRTLYNITIDVEGETKVGHKFNRTIIDSVYVE